MSERSERTIRQSSERSERTISSKRTAKPSGGFARSADEHAEERCEEAA
ncbi:hypothetical protein [Carbonactinospora thermoautotrophica]|nr:hypothetical protein [Carbonactinospora thermoautotrophica]